jgi:hypothetical protein
MTAISISTARSLLEPLVGLPIWGLRRSHGSFFIGDVGAVGEILTLPARHFDNGRVVPERRVPQGMWHFMVELCRWRIQVGGRKTSDLDEDHAHMQAVMSALNGAEIGSISLNADILTFDFSNDGQIQLGPTEYASPSDIGSQWVIFLPDGGNLSRDTRGRLRRE